MNCDTTVGTLEVFLVLRGHNRDPLRHARPQPQEGNSGRISVVAPRTNYAEIFQLNRLFVARRTGHTAAALREQGYKPPRTTRPSAELCSALFRPLQSADVLSFHTQLLEQMNKNDIAQHQMNTREHKNMFYCSNSGLLWCVLGTPGPGRGGETAHSVEGFSQITSASGGERGMRIHNVPLL